MHDAPHPQQIVQAAESFLRERAAVALAGGERDEHTAYLARVAANLLAIAARELAEPPALALAERDRLCRLLGAGLDDPRSPAELNRALADAIAAGAIGLATPGLADHLWQATLAKLAVDQPGYSTYRAHAQTARR